jgi:peroxiredoxin
MSRGISVLAMIIALFTAALGAPPKIGDRAPQFSLQNAAGQNVALKDYEGKSKLVLVFYRGYW